VVKFRYYPGKNNSIRSLDMLVLSLLVDSFGVINGLNILTCEVLVHFCHHRFLIIIVLFRFLNYWAFSRNSFDSLDSEEQLLPAAEVLHGRSKRKGDHLVGFAGRATLFEVDAAGGFAIAVQLHQVLIQSHLQLDAQIAQLEHGVLRRVVERSLVHSELLVLFVFYFLGWGSLLFLLHHSFEHGWSYRVWSLIIHLDHVEEVAANNIVVDLLGHNHLLRFLRSCLAFEQTLIRC